MIRKLRRKFICISMGMVGLVLLTLVCGLLITTVRHQETICAETLDFALSDRNPDSAAAPRFPTDGQKPPLKPDGFDAPRSRSFFVVQLSDEGEIESVSRTNLTLLDEDAETALQAALATSKTEARCAISRFPFGLPKKAAEPASPLPTAPAIGSCCGSWPSPARWCWFPALRRCW